MPTTLQNLYGTVPTNWTAAYGGNPVVPSPGASQTEAVTSNMSNLANILGLASGVNAANTSELFNQYSAWNPNLAANLQQSSANIGAGLRGELSSGTINQLVKLGMERGIAGGQTNRSPNVNAALLAALGKTSEGVQQQAEQNLTAAIGRTPRADLFNINSMLTSPADWQAAQLAANLYASAPDPKAAAEAALAALRSGVNAGGGVGGGIRTPAGGAYTPIVRTGSPGTYVLPSTSTGTNYGGVTYYGDTTPGTAQSNWNDWYNSLDQSGWTTGGGDTYMGDEPNWYETTYGFDPTDYGITYPDYGFYDWGNTYGDTGNYDYLSGTDSYDWGGIWGDLGG